MSQITALKKHRGPVWEIPVNSGKLVVIDKAAFSSGIDEFGTNRQSELTDASG